MLYRVRLRKFLDEIILFGTKKDLLEINKEKSEGKIKTKFLFYPDSLFLKIWNNVLLLLIIFLVFFIPYDIAFIDGSEESLGIIVFIDIIFYLDIGVSLNSTYYIRSGKIVDKRKSIF